MKLVTTQRMPTAGAVVGMGAAYFGNMPDVLVHAARVATAGGEGVITSVVTQLYRIALGFVTFIDCAFYTHRDRVIDAGGEGVDETTVRELLTFICEL